MTLEAWQQAGWLRRHGTQIGDVTHLWGVAVQDLADAGTPGLGAKLQFEYAYNAALKFCLIALYAEGLRPGQVSDVHHKIVRSLPLTLGPGREASADYLDACRERRDRLASEQPGESVDSDGAAGLLEFSRTLSADVRDWMCERHPELASGCG